MSGCDIKLLPGFDPSSTEMGFFVPTNKDNVPGAPKKSYLTDLESRIKRPEFDAKPRKSSTTNATSRPHGRPSVSSNIPSGPPKKKGGPSNYARERLPKKFSQHHQKDYFDLQITPQFVDKFIIDTTNRRAAAEGAGSKT